MFLIASKEGKFENHRYTPSSKCLKAIWRTPTEDDLLNSMNMGDLKQVVKAEHTFSELISTKGRTIFEHARNVHRVVIKMDGSANNRGLPDD